MPLAGDVTLVQKLENILVIERNIELPQEVHIFILERLSLVRFS